MPGCWLHGWRCTSALGVSRALRGPAFCMPSLHVAPRFLVQVHSLPGLELLYRKQLDDSRLLGFRWPCHTAADSPAGGGSSAGVMCCSLDAQLVLAAPGNEIARLAVVEDCVLPAPPASVYSMKLAQQAAAAASRRPRVQMPRLEMPASGPGEAEAGFSPLGVAAAAGKGFGQLLGQAATTVTGLAATAADSLSHVRMGGRIGPCPQPALRACCLKPARILAGIADAPCAPAELPLLCMLAERR